MYQSARWLLLSAHDGMARVARLASAPMSSSYSSSAPTLSSYSSSAPLVGVADPAGAEGGGVHPGRVRADEPALALHPHQGIARNLEEDLLMTINSIASSAEIRNKMVRCTLHIQDCYIISMRSLDK